MQYAVDTKCNKSVGTETKDGNLFGYKVKKSNTTVYRAHAKDIRRHRRDSGNALEVGALTTAHAWEF